MTFAIKAEVSDPWKETFAFSAQKTMYGGTHIAKHLRLRERERRRARSHREWRRHLGQSDRKKSGIARQTPRVSITIRHTAFAKRRLGRSELKFFSDWNDGQPQTELNFKFYRQATNKIAGISDKAAAFLRRFFDAATINQRLTNAANPALCCVS